MRGWLAMVGLVGAVLVGTGGQALAQTPPTRAFGSVTIDGRPAPQGTLVQALIGDKVCGEGVVRRVSDAIPVGYVVDVVGATQTPGCGTDGEPITFKVGGAQANEKGEFRTGAFLRLNLTVSGQVSTPTPGPTPPPFGSPTAPSGGPTTATPGATGSPPPTGTPAPGQASPSPAPGSPSPTATPGAATATAARFTATPPGTEPRPDDGDGGGGVPAALWAVVVVVLVGAAGAGGYLLYRRGA